MSDCGVCVYSGLGESSSYDFHATRVVVGRKRHHCCECGRRIEVGERHVTHSGRYDGDFFSVRCCLICDEIADAFSCDGRLYGNFWDAMWDVYEYLNVSCFDRLQTPEAKAELRRRWMKWKGLAA